MAARIALIRAATIDDAAEIARLSAQLGYPADVAVFADRLERMSGMPTHAVLVCEGWDDRLAGFVGVEKRLMIESGDKVEVVGLVVDADARRGGAGRRLVAAAEGWARAGRGRTVPAIERGAARGPRVLSRARLRTQQDPACLPQGAGVGITRRE